MTPKTKLSCGVSLLTLMCHLECSPLYCNSTTACEHTCGWMMVSAQINSKWSRFFIKGMCSRLWCSAIFSQSVLSVERFAAEEAITDNMVQLQRKKENDKRRRGKARDGHANQLGEDNEVQTLWAMLYADDVGTYHDQ